MTTTAVDEFVPTWEDPSDQRYSWIRWGSQAGAKALTRLYQDVLREYARSLKRCWEECASPMARLHIFTIINGVAYVRGPEMDDAAQERIARKLAEIERYPFASDYYRNEIRPEVVELVERLRKHPRPTRPLPELVANLEECIAAYARIMGDLHWQMAARLVKRTAEGRSNYDWPEVYEDLTGRPQAEAPILLGGLELEMTKTIRMLRKLARIVQRDPGLRNAVESGDVLELDASEAPPFKAFRSGFKALLRRYGHRTGAGFGSGTGIGSPTWNVRPEIPLRLVATYARSDIDAVEARERASAKQRKDLLRTIRRALATDPDRLARFEHELADRQGAAWHIEDHNDWMDQSSPGLVRDAAHNVGLRLVRDGVIDDPLDVVHLSIAELRSPPKDARALVAERRAEYEARLAVTAPDLIGEGEVEQIPIRYDEGEGHVGSEVRGIAASPGRYTGRARVCLPSPVPPDVDEGDILVCVDAGPDWTPVFAVLGAVVLDKGLAWQHAAVVAREFGIPAVTGTKVGTSVIEDGSTITVDGDAGIVELG